MTRPALVSLAWWLLAACYQPIAEANRPCPCATGWRCCVDDNRCVPNDGVCRPPFAKNPTLTALPVGGALDLGVFRCQSPPDEPAGQCHLYVDGATLRYDRRHHRFFMLGGGSTSVDSLFVFNPDTLEWSAVYPPTPCANRTLANYDEPRGAWTAGPSGPYPRPILNVPQDTLVPVPSLGQLALFRRSGILTTTCSTRVEPDFDGTVAQFDVDAGAWGFSAEKGDGPAALHAFEWDSASQRVVSVGQAGFSLYDPALRTWRAVLSGANLPGPLGYSHELVYAPKRDQFFYFNETTGHVYAFTFNRADPVNSQLVDVALAGDAGFPPWAQAGYASDEGSGLLVGGIANGQAAVFDPSQARFTTVVVADGGAGTLAAHAIDYDPVNGVLVFLTDYASGYHTWVWRLSDAP